MSDIDKPIHLTTDDGKIDYHLNEIEMGKLLSDMATKLTTLEAENKELFTKNVELTEKLINQRGK